MLIKVKVYPGSDENMIIRKSEDSYITKVREKAEAGQANQRVKALLIEYFKVPPKAIRLLKGGKKPNKIFEIDLV
jgi:uncharacterized protein YggU (UPF0235/DUF167 family)